ncbi:MAG TPA: hypothetical protein VFK61_00965 [Candidatus Limnocylindria bacterium]|nr:hypothetical protein [Candidatus Limnocylindria bacterium]
MIALAASALAGMAGVVADMDRDYDLVPFFIGLTFLGAVIAWGVSRPPRTPARWAANGAALLWALAAVWAGALLLLSAFVWEASSPPPQPEALYAGLTATAYHVIGLFGGALLVLIAAFGPDRWLARSSESAYG